MAVGEPPKHAPATARRTSRLGPWRVDRSAAPVTSRHRHPQRSRRGLGRVDARPARSKFRFVGRRSAEAARNTEAARKLRKPKPGPTRRGRTPAGHPSGGDTPSSFAWQRPLKRASRSVGRQRRRCCGPVWRIRRIAREKQQRPVVAAGSPPRPPRPRENTQNLQPTGHMVLVKTTEGIRCAKAASKAQREKSGIKAAGCRPAHPYCVTRPRCR